MRLIKKRRELKAKEMRFQAELIALHLDKVLSGMFR